MKEIKKVDNNSFASRLKGYVTLAGAFLAFGPNTSAQCGTADASNPVLDIDINGDGVTDVSLNWNGSTSYGPQVGGAYTTFTTTSTFQYSSYLYGLQPPSYTSIIGGTFCYVVGVSGATMGGGPNGSLYAVPGGIYQPYYFGNTATGTLTAINYWVGVLSYSFSYNKLVRNSAYANVSPGNQIIGLANSTANVCEIACAGNLFVGMGQNSNRYWSGAGTRNGIFWVGGQTYGTLYATWPGAANYSCSIGTGNIPGIPTVGYYFLRIGGPGVYTGYLSGSGSTCNLNSSPVTHLAIKFKGPDADGDGQLDTYNGWVEVSIDPKSSAITCVDSGYNACSIEYANSAIGADLQCPPNADLAIGTSRLNECFSCDATNGTLTIKKN